MARMARPTSANWKRSTRAFRIFAARSENPLTRGGAPNAPNVPTIACNGDGSSKPSTSTAAASHPPRQAADAGWLLRRGRNELIRRKAACCTYEGYEQSRLDHTHARQAGAFHSAPQASCTSTAPSACVLRVRLRSVCAFPTTLAKTRAKRARYRRRQPTHQPTRPQEPRHARPGRRAPRRRPAGPACLVSVLPYEASAGS